MTISYWPLLKEAETKWENFHNNLYQPEEVYSLLYEDGRNAILLPGTKDERFGLKRYREEIAKENKNITFYLCPESDFNKSDHAFGEASCSSDSIEAGPEDNADDAAISGAHPTELDVHGEYEPARKQRRSETIVNEYTNLIATEVQVQQSEQIVLNVAREIQKFEEDSALQEDIICEIEEHITDTVSVISAVSQAVDRSKHSFIVMRRGAPLQRTLAIWKREVEKESMFLDEAFKRSLLR